MSETPVAPAPFPCDGCGQIDTAPMIHTDYPAWQKDDRIFVKEPSFHYDCYPAEYRAVLYDNGQVLPQHATTIAAIEAAEAGTKGDALREFIQAQPDDNNLPLEQPADPAPAETPAQTEGA